MWLRTPNKMLFILWVLHCIQLFVTPWTVAWQVPLSMGFSRHEYWRGLPCPSPGDLPNPGIKSRDLHHLHWQSGSLTLAPPGKPWHCSIHYCIKRKEKRKSSLYATYIPVVSQCECKCGRTMSTPLVEDCTALFSRSLC